MKYFINFPSTNDVLFSHVFIGRFVGSFHGFFVGIWWRFRKKIHVQFSGNLVQTFRIM